jgi:flagellar export protein FliJ
VNGSVFRFRLERVRALRERKEQQAQQELAHAISLRSGAETELHTAEAELERARALTGEPQALTASELVARQAFLERIEAQRGAQAQELEQRKATVLERDATLTVAATEHETLKRLRERQHGEHRRAIAGREQSELDEIAAARFGRSGT